MRIFKKLTNSVFLMIFAVISAVGFFVAQKPSTQKFDVFAATYETDSSYLSDLANDATPLESAYSLSQHYPLSCENQTSSNFCWIYSSSKAMETSFMVQMGEYYNFSEVALALLDYQHRVSLSGTGMATFNLSGDFDDFATIYQREGLVFESDVSNSIYNDFKNENYSDYGYVSNYATKEFNSVVKPYNISGLSYYNNLSDANKRNIIKRYIKNYGGLFAGIEGPNEINGNALVGAFYTESYVNDFGVYEFYTYNRNKLSSLQDDTWDPLSGNHAICIIGWCDTVNTYGDGQGAFLAMNSWGSENDSHAYFFIPYSYTYLYSTFAGFICDSETAQNAKINGTTTASFTTNILSGSNELNNFFCYDDNIAITYNLNVASLENVKVRVFSGGREFTNYFSVTKDNVNKNVTIEVDAPSNAFYGGYYTINFYNSGSLIGKKSIYIYSATETEFFRVYSVKDSSASMDSYALMNTCLSAANSATLCFSDLKDCYFISFIQSDISNKTVVESSPVGSQKKAISIAVTDVDVKCSGNPMKEYAYTDSYIINHFFHINTNENNNRFSIQIGIPSGLELSAFENCLFRFTLKIGSTLYDDCDREFIFNIFVSSRDGARTSDLNKVFYEVNDGINGSGAITKYPNYTLDSGMTTISLPTPQKADENFMGWYQTSTFDGGSVSTINSSFSGTLVFYAKWEFSSVDYYSINLALLSATDYSGYSKSTSSLIYGDSIVVRFTFNKNLVLNSYNYTVYYYFYGIQDEPICAYLTGGDTYHDFALNFPDLQSGSYTFSIKVEVVIENNLTVEKTANCSVSIAKKAVSFTFSDLSCEYNGLVQVPTVSMVNDFYVVDKQGKTQSELFVFGCLVPSKNAGQYTYSVTSLLNKNYSFDKDSASCILVINPKPVTLVWSDETTFNYDGANHVPEYTIDELVAGDVINFQMTIANCVNAGEYTINIEPTSVSNGNYSVSSVDCHFTIQKANVTIKLKDTTDRVQTKSGRRNVPAYIITGDYPSISNLGLNIITEAQVATKSGKYSISCSLSNTNYNCNVIPATYTLTGYYYVYYQLGNGNSFTEIVEEGQSPKGVTKEQLNAPLFSKIKYSDDYNVTGEDIYVEVSLEDYTTIVYGAMIVGAFVIICVVVYFKKRESKVR